MSSSSRALEFGNLLRETRRKKGLSQAELGGGRYSGSYISHIEGGRRTPTPEVIDFLARRLGISPMEWGIQARTEVPDIRSAMQVAPQSVENLLIAERARYERDWSSAASHAERAAEEASATGDMARHWEARYVLAQARHAAGAFFAAGQIASELAEHETAKKYAVARTQALSLASVSYRASDRIGWAIAYGARAVEAATGTPASIEAEATMSLVSALSEAGHSPVEVEPYIERLDALCPSLSSDHACGMVRWTIGTAAFFAGDVERGLAEHERARQLLSPQRDPRAWMRFHLSAAMFRLGASITDGVAELLRIAALGLDFLGNQSDISELRVTQARLCILEGRPEEGVAIIEELLSKGDHEAETNHGERQLVLARGLLACGRTEEAHAGFLEASRLLEAEGRLKAALDALHQAADIGESSGFLTQDLTTPVKS